MGAPPGNDFAVGNDGGRPTVYSVELADKICSALSEGKPLAKICKEDWAPVTSTVYKWRRENDEFSLLYEKAREDQADYLTDDSLQLAEDPLIDTARAKLIIDTRKWFASKMNRRYADKSEVAVTGAGGKPLSLVVEVVAAVPPMKAIAQKESVMIAEDPTLIESKDDK